MGRRLFEEVTTPDKAEGWTVSASQIKRWRECPRAWGFEYIQGLRPPPSKAAALGSAVHRLLELHFKSEPWPEDADPKVIKLARAVIDSGALPSPGFFVEPENVERAFLLKSGPIQIRGFIDLLVPKARPPMVADHKTSSDPARYGLKPETLGDDIQATIYAAAALDLFGVDRVECQWTYVRTRGKSEVIPVRAPLDRESTRENLNRDVLPPAREILEVVAQHEAEGVQPLDLPPVPESCGNWGGCAHAEYCPRTRDQLLTAAGWIEPNTQNEEQGTETMSLIEMLKAKKAAQAAQTPNPEPETKTEEAPKAAPKKGKKLPPPRINAPESEADTAPEATPEATPEPEAAPSPSPEAIEFSRSIVIDRLRDGPLELAKSRKKATPDRPFVKKAVIASLVADGLATCEDTKNGRLLTDSRQAGPEAAPEAPETPVEASPEPEAPTPAPEVEAVPAPPETPSTESKAEAPQDAPLGRRLVALYMRKDGRVIVEIDPAGLVE
jgi:hypothetical protein